MAVCANVAANRAGTAGIGGGTSGTMVDFCQRHSFLSGNHQRDKRGEGNGYCGEQRGKLQGSGCRSFNARPRFTSGLLASFFSTAWMGQVAGQGSLPMESG